MELPRECWELIFSFLDHHRRLEPLSLACKQFLSISDALRTSLSLPTPSAPSIPSLLARFCNLRSIDLSSFLASPDHILLQISRSCPNLRRLDLSNQRRLPLDGLVEIGSRIKHLEALVLSKLHHMQDRDLFEIGRLFPLLEELDISYPQHLSQVSDEGVSVLSRSLLDLRRIDISGNHFLTNRSLGHLSTCCSLLRDVAARDCTFITSKGVNFLIRNAPNLVSLRVNVEFNLADEMWIHLFSEARVLSSLEISYSYFGDDLLSSVAKANLPLRAVNLSYSRGFMFDGISLLLSNNRLIESLDLEGVSFLTDEHMIELCKFLPKLKLINLSSCAKIGSSTFYFIMRSCPLLEEIRMEKTELGNVDFLGKNTELVNSQVRSLYLARNCNLCDDWCIKQLALACPKLQFLDMNWCPSITRLGVSAILEKCSEIRHLDISHCDGLYNLVINFDLPRLEILHARGLRLHNQFLPTIGRRCFNLLSLDLQGCFNMSDKDVKEAVGCCRNLREINLRWCNDISVHTVPWLVFSRPSLRKINPPNSLKLSENQRNLFLRHGCFIDDA